MASPSIALIIAKHMKKKDPELDSSDDMMPSEDEGKQDDMEMSAVQDLMDALKADDAKGVHLALKDFMELCGGYSSPPSDEE